MFGFASSATSLCLSPKAFLQEDNISKILSAANVKVEPYWPSLFAKLFAKNGIGSLIANVGAGEGVALATEISTLSILMYWQLVPVGADEHAQIQLTL